MISVPVSLVMIGVSMACASDSATDRRLASVSAPLAQHAKQVADKHNGCLCRSLKSCQDVAVACRSDLSNSLLSGTVYFAKQPFTAETQSLVSSCLSSFLTGNIQNLFEQLTLGSPIATKGHAGTTNKLPAAGATVTIHDAAESDASSEASQSTADADVVDDYLKAPSMHRQWQPLTLVVGVPALPKGALVEVQPEACTLEAMTPQPSSHGSSDDEEECMSERHQSRAQSNSWPARLTNQEGTLSHGRGHWSALVSLGAYFSCQVVFDLGAGDRINQVQCVVDTVTEQLLAAGLTASKDLMHLTLYANNAMEAVATGVCKSFHACWLEKHKRQARMCCLPVCLLMTGLGAELQVLQETCMCIKLVAYRCNDV